MDWDDIDDIFDDERYGDERDDGLYKSSLTNDYIKHINQCHTGSLGNNQYLLQKEQKKEDFPQLEIEDERSNGNREVYINRGLIFSNRYIESIKLLGENRICSKNILNSAREMLKHHHGDKYEDLYFIDSESNKVLSRTDYRAREQEVLPTEAMKEMAKNNPNIISIHNHPTDALPSYEDIKTCYFIGYKYGLIACHGGDIFQYKTLDKINKAIYESECSIYYKREQDIADRYEAGKLTKMQFETEHQKSFIELSAHLIDAGVIIKEVLWNGRPQKQRDVSTNNE